MVVCLGIVGLLGKNNCLRIRGCIKAVLRKGEVACRCVCGVKVRFTSGSHLRHCLWLGPGGVVEAQ